jgi:hypothetical protein
MARGISVPLVAGVACRVSHGTARSNVVTCGSGFAFPIMITVYSYDNQSITFAIPSLTAQLIDTGKQVRVSNAAKQKTHAFAVCRPCVCWTDVRAVLDTLHQRRTNASV